MNIEPHYHTGLQDIVLQEVVFRFQPLIFQGVGLLEGFPRFASPLLTSTRRNCEGAKPQTAREEFRQLRRQATQKQQQEMNEAALEDSGCEWILMDFGAKYLHVFHCKPTERPQVSKGEVLLMV